MLSLTNNGLLKGSKLGGLLVAKQPRPPLTESEFLARAAEIVKGDVDSALNDLGNVAHAAMLQGIAPGTRDFQERLLTELRKRYGH
jgi:hypothetical protein